RPEGPLRSRDSPYPGRFHPGATEPGIALVLSAGHREPGLLGGSIRGQRAVYRPAGSAKSGRGILLDIAGATRNPAQSGELHRLRVPMDYGPAIVAEVAQQGCAGSAEAENGILHDRLACAHRLEEIAQVVIAIQVSVGRY